MSRANLQMHSPFRNQRIVIPSAKLTMYLQYLGLRYPLECMHWVGETRDRKQRHELLGLAARLMRVAVEMERAIDARTVMTLNGCVRPIPIGRGTAH
jgi:hypothetical protein